GPSGRSRSTATRRGGVRRPPERACSQTNAAAKPRIQASASGSGSRMPTMDATVAKNVRNRPVATSPSSVPVMYTLRPPDRRGGPARLLALRRLDEVADDLPVAVLEPQDRRLPGVRQVGERARVRQHH